MTFAVDGASAVALARRRPAWLRRRRDTGCGGFKWPLDSERAALVRADKPSLANGGALAFNVATTLELQPLAGAGLPKAPERAPKSAQAFAGHFILAAPAKPGVYKITISSPGWIDVLDGEAYLHPKAFTGATGCEGARKSVKFDSAVPPARAPVQRRRGRSDFGHRLARPISAPPASSRHSSDSAQRGQSMRGNAASR